MDTALVLSEDHDLQEVWPQMILEYENVTGCKLDPKSDFNTLTGQIEQDIHASQFTNNKSARKIIGDIGKCLQQFGGMIAQAASVAFGPSTQCWNAISFFINVAQSYRKVLDGFLALMEYSLAFLKRLNFFLDQSRTGVYLDPHLRGPAYAILRHFLELLKCSHNLATRKRDKVKLVLNIVLFNDDAGVRASLSQMEALVLSFTHAEVDQILVDVKGLARYMRESAEDAKRQYSDLMEHIQHTEGLVIHAAEDVQSIDKRMDSHFSMEQRNVDLKRIREALQLDGTPQKWTNRQSTISGNKAKGTADWLLRPENTPFRKWADILDVNANKIMAIRGQSGFGKSYLFSQVVAFLEDQYQSSTRTSTSIRTYVLYYYFGEVEKDDSARKCLSALVYQLAALDETGKHATVIAEACKQSAKIATAESLWDLLVATTTTQQGRCFLCIDGCSSREDREPAQMFSKMLQHVAIPAPDAKQSSLRILLTGTPEDIESFGCDEDTFIYLVSLGPSETIVGSDSSSDAYEDTGRETFANEADLIAVAQARVDKLQPEIRRLLTQDDIQAIVAGVKGHYEHLESKLKQISACSCVEDVREIIDNAEQGFISTTQDSIKALNNALSPDAIIQLNELLTWIYCCRAWANLELLQSVLVFKLHKSLFLETMIRTKFSMLLTVDGEGVVTAPEGLREILATLVPMESLTVTPEPMATPLNTAEVELCRRFIRNACDPSDFKRFGFDSFFDALAGKQGSKIHIDIDEVLELTILQTCIRSLTEDQTDARFSPLREYACRWFYEHLVTVMEHMETFDYDKEVLRATGSSLARLLRDDAAISAWWNDDALNVLKVDWCFRGTTYLEALTKFVRHRSVAQGFNEDSERELQVTGKATNGSNMYALLQKVASKLASKWLEQDLYQDDAFIVAFTLADIHQQSGKEYDGYSNPSVAEIQEFVKWARANTTLSIDEAQWVFCEGSAYFLCGHRSNGFATMRQAEEDGYSHWALPLRLADAYLDDKDFQAALGYCHRFTSFKARLLHTDEAYTNEYYSRMLFLEGECHKNLNCSDAAVRCFMEVLECDETSDYVHEEALRKIFQLWRESREYSSTIDLLRAWRDTSKQGLLHWIMKIVNLEDVHLCILDAVRYTAASHAEVIDAYRLALRSLLPSTIKNDDDKKQAANQLRYLLALMLFYGSTSDSDHQEALSIWEDLILHPNGALNSSWISYKSARKLFRSLVEKAANSANGSDCEYTARLTRLATTDHEDIREYRQSGKDPRLSLARIYHKRGCMQEARRVLRDRIRSAFDKWSGDEDDDRLTSRYKCVAYAFLVIGDDSNAIAVWQSSRPKAKLASAVEDVAHDYQAEVGADKEVNNLGSTTQPDESEPQADVKAASRELAVDENSDDEDTQGMERRPYFDSFFCDGCGDDFDVSSNAYICRDCKDVQLCPNCYTKVVSDELSPTICSSSHEFLYIPTVNQVLWEKMERDQIVVDDVLVPRDAWIDGLREQWDLQQEQIDTEKLEAARKMKAARFIATSIVTWKRGQKKKLAARWSSF